MGNAVTNQPCNLALLRAYLDAALAEADKCDPVVAIHVATARAFVDRHTGTDG